MALGGLIFMAMGVAGCHQDERTAQKKRALNLSKLHVRKPKRSETLEFALAQRHMNQNQLAYALSQMFWNCGSALHQQTTVRIR